MVLIKIHCKTNNTSVTSSAAKQNQQAIVSNNHAQASDSQQQTSQIQAQDIKPIQIQMTGLAFQLPSSQKRKRKQEFLS